jgi:cell division septation protein DedD
MNNPEKSYLEIKVTLLHIVILLAGVIIIGVFLFYLGYQAGKSSLNPRMVQTQLTENGNETKEISILDETGESGKEPVKEKEQKTSINEEMKLHQQPVKKRTEKPETIQRRTLRKETYYSIQVGAFSSFTNAKNYSEKFRKLGYPAEVLASTLKDKTLYRVRVGRFTNKAAADKEMTKLEKMEKKKFAIRKSD